MSLAKTLLKVAIGVALAKGVSTLSKKGAGSATAAEAGRGTPYGGGKSTGLEDIFQDSLGDRSRQPADRGAAQGGGLDDLFGKLAGNAPQPRSSTRTNAPQGGLEDILGGLLGGKASGGTSAQPGTSGGGLGDLLGSLLGGNAPGGASTGGMTRQAGTTPGAGGIEDLLGTVFGGAAAGRAPRDEDLAAALILRAMVQAAKADGELDEAERQGLMKNMGEASQDEIAFVTAELKRPVDIEGLVRQVPAGMEQQVYAMSLLAINLDSQTEAKYLHNLAQALELGTAEVNALHDRAGAQRIYR